MQMGREYIQKTLRSGASGGNANQKQEEMPLPSSKDGYYQRDKDDKS